MNVSEKKVDGLLNILVKCWSNRSSSKYTIENPARGQCNVTSLVVNDILGGEILKTNTPEGWHYYNRIENERYDLTKSQFLIELIYEDIQSCREETFSHINEEQYIYLKACVNKQIDS